MTNTERALDMLNAATILDVSGYLIHNWIVNNFEELEDFEDDDVIFSCSHTDENGYVFEFEFNKENFNDVKVVNHGISLVDNTGQIVDINCFKLEPLKI